MAYALQKPFKKELKGLHKQCRIVPLGVDEADEWCNSVVIVQQLNGTILLHKAVVGVLPIYFIIIISSVSHM